MKTEIIGLSKLNLEPNQEKYMHECIAMGRTWFVTRKRAAGRCIQGSSETRENAERTLRGWPGSTLIQIVDNKVIWPK
jgi:hypothetical protein